MNKAYVFQHRYTGVQIFIYHVNDELVARVKFINIVTEDKDWIYIGVKITC